MIPRLGRAGRPLRIAYGRFFHEANAHNPLLTGRDAFERMHAVEGEVLASRVGLRGSELTGYMPHAELTGFNAAARAAGRVETVPLASFLAVPSGRLTPECFDWILETLLARLAAVGPVDGVYLALHGSAEVEGLDEAPEAVVLRRVRELVGPEVMIAVSYDLHANLSAGIVDPVDVLVAYRTNPHWDLAPTGWRAGNRLIRALRGEIRPVQAWRKLPVVLGGGVGIDLFQPLRSVFRWMRRLERDERVVSASLFMVHPFTSAKDLGWAAHICTDGDPALAEDLAEQLAERLWEASRVALPKMLSVGEALDEARRIRRRPPWGPVTLVDCDDIVGAGAPGGNTRIIQAVVADDRGLEVLVPVHDPAALAELWDQPDGRSARVVLSGTPGYDQPEVAVHGRVVTRTDGELGRIVRLDVGRARIAVCESSPLPIHPSFWRALKLNPRRAGVIVQKNFFHYRIFYLTTSFRHLPVVSAGASSIADVRARQFAIPMAPVVELDDWRPGDRALRA